jgi:putative transposase
VVRPKDKRAEAQYLVDKYNKPKARVCCLLGLSLSTLGYQEQPKNDEPIREKFEELVEEHRRFGHPRLFVLIKRDLPEVNHKRTRRIYREMGLQINRRKRKKLGGHPRLPATTATSPNEIWAIDFMFDYIVSGRRLKVLTTVDEFAKESPGILVDHSIRGVDVIDFLDHLANGNYPKIIRVDQGTEFTSRAMLDWAYKHHITLEFTRVRKPNQIIESFNSRVRDECLNEHVFMNLEDAREKIDAWHWKYNNINPHSSLGMQSPAEFAKERRTVLAS